MRTIIVVIIAAILAGTVVFQTGPSYQVSNLAYSGDLSMIQSSFRAEDQDDLPHGNLEAIVPMADKGFAYLSRNNQNWHLHWYPYHVEREDVGHIDSVSLVQGPNGHDGNNLEFLAR